MPGQIASVNTSGKEEVVRRTTTWRGVPRLKIDPNKGQSAWFQNRELLPVVRASGFELQKTEIGNENQGKRKWNDRRCAGFALYNE